MHAIKSFCAGLVVGLIAHDLSWLSAALLTLFFAVLLYAWDLIRVAAEGGAGVAVKTAPKRVSAITEQSGKTVCFLIGVDTLIIAIAGALTYWGVGWLRAGP